MDCCSWKQKVLLVFPLLDSCGGKKKNPVGGSSNFVDVELLFFPIISSTEDCSQPETGGK